MSATEGSRTMNPEAIERLVRSLVIAMMNGLLYFTGHRRVTEAAEEAVKALDEHFKEQPRLAIGMREGLLVFEGAHLYDLSIYAYRLIQAMKEHGVHGLCFDRGVRAEEITWLIDVLLGGVAGSAAGANDLLRLKGVVHIRFE
ncbi:MAG: hypothetical protein KJ645_02610, partial [Planctomycetes bacterium]|nr:hypothetical protein [Planctomycetota bacterium]